MKLKGFNEEEKQRYVQLRAMEWSSWPAFISMGIGVLLLPFFGILKSALIIMALNFIWSIFSIRFISVKLANIGIYVKKLMWVTCPATAVYFFINHQIVIGVVALFWGVVCMFLQIAKVPRKAELGQIAEIMYEQID